MRLQPFLSAAVCALSLSTSQAFAPSRHDGRSTLSIVKSMVVDVKSMTSSAQAAQSLTKDLISKLKYREAKDELERRSLDTSGTLSAMRERLRHAAVEMNGAPRTENENTHVIDEDALNEAFAKTGIKFVDSSDPDFECKDLIREIYERAKKSHWKGATRKLRRLTRRFGRASEESRSVPGDVYMAVLRSCMEDRLHGARAAESSRKIMELMVEDGYSIPSDVANFCVKNAVGEGPGGTHEGFGGIDTALAMLAAIELSENNPTLNEDTYARVVTAMATGGSLDDSIEMLRKLVVDKSQTFTVQVFADIAEACVIGKDKSLFDAEKVMTILSYAKAAGYELDNVASTVDGRRLLAAGVIAAEKLNNIGLGLRLLTAASNAQGCEPDRGDALIATTSQAAQRACTIIHREAVYKAAKDNSWKLCVKLLELMVARGLTPSTSVWRNVVTCCAKAEKSRKATSLLLDWVELAKRGRAEKPSLRIFNTVVNVCEVCGEEDLTIRVLDAMKETHDTEGNLITFNIALKRLAKQGNTQACEGIIIGMLQNGIEPSVVTYTTAIAACVTDPKKSDIAMEWIRRMRSRLVQPNVITYNTALASCLDGTLDATKRGSRLAAEMVGDIQRQVDAGVIEMDEYTNIVPNFYTRTLARQLMKQLKENWEIGAIDKKIAKATLRLPLLQLVEFLKTDLAEMAEKQKQFVKAQSSPDSETIDPDDEEFEYSTAISIHRAAAV